MALVMLAPAHLEYMDLVVPTVRDNCRLHGSASHERGPDRYLFTIGDQQNFEVYLTADPSR